MKFYHLPVILTIMSLLAVCVIFTGCYTIKQGATMLGYLGRAVPLELVSSEQAGDDFIRLVTD
ncbi:MAG: aminopeptidase, partial [Treponema sp.]|nr:aminopeptidase [Treponema sp.]